MLTASLLLAGALAAAEGQPPAIAHTPLRCVGASSFPRIEARLSPSKSMATVFFATRERAGWYAVHASGDGEAQAAVLPRPRSTHSFRYYVEAIGEDAETARTPEYVVSVVDRQEQCAAGTSVWTTSASGIIVEPPPAARPRPGHASTMPPVPPGFSTRGTASDVGQFEIGSVAAIATGTVLAAAGVAAAFLTDKPAEAGTGQELFHPFETTPGIEMVDILPPSGSTLSLSTGSLVLRLRIFTPDPVPGARIRATLHVLGGTVGACIVLQTIMDLEAGRTQVVTVSGPTRRAGVGCADQGGSRPPIDQLQVNVNESSGRTVFGTGRNGIPNITVFYPLTE